MKHMLEVGIRAKKLTVVKNKQPIVKRLTFDVPTNSVVGLIGPSGSGKTTLMRAIVGVQKVAQGRLEVLGRPGGSAALRSKIGYVTQAPAVYPDLTVFQNLRYFATITRSNNDQIKKVLSEVDLEKQAGQLVETLSGGQKARVSLAVALLGNPEVLVLDEPTVGLDPVLRRDLWALFRRLAGQGKTLLVSSHVMDEAEQCDSLLIMRDGELLWAGGKDELFHETHRSTVEDAFLAIVEGEK